MATAGKALGFLRRNIMLLLALTLVSTITTNAETVYDKDGLAADMTSEGCFWLHKSGVRRRTHCFDNGSDYFQEGLARYIDANGKFGFMNKRLKIVVAAKYDFAFPFKQGRSDVCVGCKQVPDASGEHHAPVGGQWGVINAHGKLLKPLAPKAAAQ